jgi:hypothetical protein
MCETRYWKNTYSFAEQGRLIIGGIRSDNVKFQVVITDVQLYSVLKGLKSLEEFRSCGCDGKLYCNKHQT